MNRSLLNHTRKLALLLLLNCSNALAANPTGQDLLPNLTDEQSAPLLNEQLRRNIGRISASELSIDTLNSLFTNNVLQTVYGGTSADLSACAKGSVPFFTSAGVMSCLAPSTSGYFLKTQGAGADPIYSTIVHTYAAGSYIIGGPTKMVTANTGDTSYEKIVEIYVPGSGTLTTKFMMRIASGSGTPHVYGKIYRNGVAVGTDQESTSATLAEFTENIAGWSAGDLCQLYAKKLSDTVYDIGDLRLYELTPAVEAVNTDYKPIIHFGSGAPNTVLGSQGDLYLRLDGGATTTLYVKTAGSTWTAK